MPFSRDLLHPGIKPASLMSPALSARFFITSATWETRVSRKENPDGHISEPILSDRKAQVD